MHTGYFFLGRGCLAFIGLSQGYLTWNRWKKLHCHQVFCDLQGIIQIKGIVFIQKTPSDLNMAFFPFNFLEISSFCSILFPFSHASSVSSTSTKYLWGRAAPLPSRQVRSRSPRRYSSPSTSNCDPAISRSKDFICFTTQDPETQLWEWIRHRGVVCSTSSFTASLRQTCGVGRPGVPILQLWQLRLWKVKTCWGC